MKLSFLRRGFQIIQHRRKYDLGTELFLHTRNIITYDALSLQAAENCDLDAIRNMLEKGEALIYDTTPHGQNYLEACIKGCGPEGRHRFDKAHSIKLKATVDFFLDSGMKVEPSISWVFNMLMGTSWSKKYTLQEETMWQNILRKILPLLPWDVDRLNSMFFDTHNIERPLAHFLLRQKISFCKPTIVFNRGLTPVVYLKENMRFMLLDPYAQRLKSLLDNDKNKFYNLLVFISRNANEKYSLSRQSSYSSGLFGLLDMYHHNRSPEVRFCCLNRLVLLLHHGWNARECDSHVTSGNQHMPTPKTVSHRICNLVRHDRIMGRSIGIGWLVQF